MSGPAGGPAWAVAVISARESIETLVRCTEAARAALANAGHAAGGRIDVMVNGNRPLADATARWLRRQPAGCVRVWFIPLADKSNAWNEYVHRVAGEAEFVFFVDGYVEVGVEALARLGAALHAQPEALAATGVPTDGRSAAALRAELLREGGLHGNLFALRGSLVEQLRDSGFRLPRGLYRGDSLLNAGCSFRFDPARQPWDRSAVWVQPDVTWRLAAAAASRWSVAAATAHWRRLVRQAQGRLEVGALREHLSVAKRPPQALPATAIELVEGWLAREPAAARRLFRAHPLTRLALRRMRRAAVRQPVAESAPILLACHDAPADITPPCAPVPTP